MTSLLALPTEILELVCQYPQPEDLSNLSQTCRTLRAVVQPALYSTITWTWRKKNDMQPIIPLLLRTVIAYPRLASHIKCLDFGSIDWLCPDEDGFPTWPTGPAYNLSLDTIEAYDRALSDLLNLPADLKESDLNLYQMDAVVVLLILLCESLQHLVINIDSLVDNYYIEKFGERGALGPEDNRPLSTLRRVDVVCPDPVRRIAYIEDRQGGPHPFENILGLFYLNNLVEFNISPFKPTDQCIRQQELKPWPFSSPPDLSKLQALRLCPALTDDLMPVLSLATNLKVLHLCFSFPTSISPLDLDNLRDGIAFSQDSLEELTLRYDLRLERGVDVGSVTQTVQGDIGSFHKFTKLKKLEIPLAFLIGLGPPLLSGFGNRLSPAVQHLTLTNNLFGLGAFEWKGPQILAFLQNFCGKTGDNDVAVWNAATPSLTEIVLAGPWNLWEKYCGWNSQSLQDLETACEGQSLTIRFLLNQECLSDDRT